MICSRRVRWFSLFFLLVLSSSPAFAETIELVTYYPAPATSDLHVNSLTVGSNYAGATPPDGQAYIFDRLGIGTTAPAGSLHVVGPANQPDKVLFMPGTGGTMSVGIGMSNPPSLLGLGVDTGAAGTRQAITIGNAGLGAPTAEGTTSAGDKLVMWNDAATAYKSSIGLNANNELWLQSSGNNATNKISFYTSSGSTTPSERMRIGANGNVGIGVANPGVRLDVAQGGACRVGNAYLSSGWSSLASFASNAWFNGTAWVIPDATRKSGLLEMNDEVIEFYQTQTAGAADWFKSLSIAGNGLMTMLSSGTVIYAGGGGISAYDNPYTGRAVKIGTNQGGNAPYLSLSQNGFAANATWYIVMSPNANNLSFDWGGTRMALITPTGCTYATICGPSDLRLKKNIAPLGGGLG